MIANIFGMHLGCKVRIEDGVGVIETVATNGQNALVVALEGKQGVWTDCVIVEIEEDKPKILLKPLSSITEEDKRELVADEKFKFHSIETNGCVFVLSMEMIGVFGTVERILSIREIVWLASKSYDVGLVPDEYKEIIGG